MNSTTQVFMVGPDEAPDKYRLLRQIGGGGEAELWEAEVDLAGERERVAVKILRDQHAENARDWQRRWTEQADLLRLVSHPSVVGMHGYFEGARMHPPGRASARDRAHYLVMNWIDGQDLREWVPRNAGPENRFTMLRILGQIADVLDWLHGGRATPSGRAVIHGDLSPANVIIDRNGQAIIVDFGLFRMVDAVTALPAGTRGYCAPEVFARGEYTIYSDRYSFGALAYYMLTGTHPRPDPAALREAMAVLGRQAGHPVDAIEQLVAIVGEEPERRPSAGEWVRLMMFHSSTVVPHSGPLPPSAPDTAPDTAPGAGGPARGVPAPIGPPSETWRRFRQGLLVGTFGAMVLTITVLATALVLKTGDAGAEKGAAGTPTTGAPRTGAPSTGTPSTADSRGSAGGGSPGGTPVGTPRRVSLVPEEGLGPPEFNRGPITVNDTVYPTNLHVWSPDSEGSSEEYNLLRKYREFHARIGLGDVSPTGSTATVTLKVDDRTVATETVGLFEVKSLDAVIAGGNRLRVEIKASNTSAGVAIIDPYLVPVG